MRKEGLNGFLKDMKQLPTGGIPANTCKNVTLASRKCDLFMSY